MHLTAYENLVNINDSISISEQDGFSSSVGATSYLFGKQVKIKTIPHTIHK